MMSPMIARASGMMPPAPMPWNARNAASSYNERGQGGQRRADHEDHDRQHEQPLAAVDVRQLAEQRRGDRRGDQERGGHPGLRLEVVQVVADRLDRGRDDGLVERGKE